MSLHLLVVGANSVYMCVCVRMHARTLSSALDVVAVNYFDLASLNLLHGCGQLLESR